MYKPAGRTKYQTLLYISPMRKEVWLRYRFCIQKCLKPPKVLKMEKSILKIDYRAHAFVGSLHCISHSPFPIAMCSVACVRALGPMMSRDRSISRRKSRYYFAVGCRTQVVRVAQRIRHLTTNQEIAGSNPVVDSLFPFFESRRGLSFFPFFESRRGLFLTLLRIAVSDTPFACTVQVRASTFTSSQVTQLEPKSKPCSSRRLL